MIDSSDIVIVYTIRNYGGAYEAKKYSEQKRKSDYINLKTQFQIDKQPFDMI